MQTNFMIQRIMSSLVYGSLLAIGLTLTIMPAASAQEKPLEIPLKVKGIKGELALFKTIEVEVENLPEWTKQKGNDPSKFILYIDGNAVKDLPLGLVENKLQFDLKRNSNNKEAWTTILSRKTGDFLTRTVPITVGYDGVQVGSNVKSTLTIVNGFWFKIFTVSFLALIALFGWLACKSDIIRDAGPQPGGIDQYGKAKRKTYSMARTQMALWFFVVIISYVFIWMVTSDLSNLDPSVLGLIGISAGTGLVAAIVDSGKRSDQENLSRALEEKGKNDEVEAARLKSEINALNAAVSAVPAPANLDEQRTAMAGKQAELAAKENEIAQANQKIQELSPAAQAGASKRFIDDILSDDDGISFHRFQIFAWTIVLIFIFIASVYNTLTMPDFDATLLGLMGISGGTYIGFKLPKQQG